MATQIYKVQDPSGQIREIEGPAGASDEEVIAQAQRLFGSTQQAQPTEPTRVAPDVQAQRDQVRLPILNEELAKAQQRLQETQAQLAALRQSGAAPAEVEQRLQRATADVGALQREITRAGGTPAAAPALAPTIAPAASQPAMVPAEISGGQIPGAAPDQTAPAVTEPTMASQLLRQAGLTARAVVEGGAGLAGVVTDPIAALVNQFVPPEKRLSTLKSVFSTLLTSAGVPEAERSTERIIQQATQSMVGGAPVIAAGQRMAQAGPAVVQAVGRQLGAMPTAQTASAAGAGAGSQTAAELGVGPAGQVVAGLAGGFAGGNVANIRQAPGQAVRDIEAAERAGVRLMTSDISPPTSVAGRVMERVGEAIPVTGTTGVRAAQQRERVAAVNNLLKDYGFPNYADDLPEKIASSVLAKREADLKRLTARRNEVINRLDSAGAVPTNRLTQVANDEIARLSKGAGDPVIDRVISDLQAFSQSTQNLTLQGIELRRQVLRNLYADPSLANVKTIGEVSTNKLYSALVDDMGSFIKATGRPNDFTKWKASNAELSSMANELNNTTLKSILNRGEVTPEIADRMLFSNRPSDIKLLYTNLTPDGRNVAKIAILQRAATNASQQAERGGATVIDPTKFSSEIGKLSRSIDVFFSPDELKRVEGLTRVLDLTKRAQEVQRAAPVGTQSVNVPLGAVQAAAVGTAATPAISYLSSILGPYYGPAAGVTGALSVGAAARFYESAPVRNLLRKIADTRPGSKAERELLTKLSALKVPAPQFQENQ
jgi:hypothetical protein